MLPHYYLSTNGKKVFCVDSGLTKENEFGEFDKSVARIALIDRDGVVIKKAGRHKYWFSAAQIEVLPIVSRAIKYLNDCMYNILVKY